MQQCPGTRRFVCVLNLVVCKTHIGWNFKHPTWHHENKWEEPLTFYTIIYDMLEELEEEPGDLFNTTVYALF